MSFEQTIDTEKFIERAILQHGDKYDYTKSIYTKYREKVVIICKTHGEFLQLPSNHWVGMGCPVCANQKPYTAETFSEKANKIHNNKYSYQFVIYKNKRTKVNITCPLHGIFSQLPQNHLAGRGCPACANQIPYTNKTFAGKANEIHGSRYLYNEMNYVNNDSKILIICPNHGQFTQRAGSHLEGTGCPKCSDVISRSEIAWLDSLNINEDYRNKIVKIGNKSFRVDAYDPTTNTIYEFNGDYWHGNPQVFDPDDYNKNNKKIFRELYESTIFKEFTLVNAGYKVISIWENEWRKAL